MTTNRTTSWKDIWLLWVCGVVAAAEFGKFASMIPELRAGYDLSLTDAGWLSSLIEIGGATLGLVAGKLTHRTGTRRAIQMGLAALTLGCAAEYALGNPGLWVGRVAEAAGYLMVVVACPSLIIDLATVTDRPHALSLWSTFVPVGLALGAVGSATAVAKLGVSVTLGLWGVIPALLFALTFGLPARDHDDANAAPAPSYTPKAGVWILCAAFGAYVVMFVGVVGMLPTFLQEQMHASIVVSGLVVGGASFATIFGSAYLSWRLRRDATAFQHNTIRELEIVGLVIPAAILMWMFCQSGGTPTFVALLSALAILAVALSGIMSSLLYALVSHVAHEDPRNQPAITSGLLTHFGASGSLIGPPLTAWVATNHGWPVVAVLIAALAAAAIALEVWSRARP